ncbi:MAG: hypothetical protein KBC35_00100 [Candidatus Pacebacteria bacterium]|nr:hypothetical protein [Candidatus Paceibacterota bacterium]
MNIHKMKLASLLFALAFLIPQASQAYFTTAQSATKISDDTVLFTVTYKFGFLNRELYMPIVTKQGLQADSSEFSVGYDLMSEDDEILNIASSAAVVLANDEDIQIKNGRYYLPQGKSAEFTFVALVSAPTSDTADASLLITHLPFTTIKEGKSLEQHLNPSELQYYRTPEVEI